MFSTSSYKFNIVGEARVFYHKEQKGDCEYCFSITPKNLPYCHHWLSDKSRETIREIQESRADKNVKVKIIYSNSRTYILPSVGFLSNDPMDVGRSIVSHLLKKLFYGNATVYFKLKYVLKVNGEFSVNCTTSELAVEHHMDVPNAVRVADKMLIQKILKHLAGQEPLQLSQGQIKLHARRVLKHRDEAAKYVLPLQYRLKREFVKPQTKIDKHNLRYTTSFFFRACERNKHIILMVPYSFYKSGETKYLILNDNEGYMEDILEITNSIDLFDIDEDPVRCIFCDEVCEESVSLAIHKAFKCGSGFEVFSSEKREMKFDDIGMDHANNRVITLEGEQKEIHIDKEIDDDTHIWDIFIVENDCRIVPEGNEKPVDPCKDEIQDIKVENEHKVGEVGKNQHENSDEENTADEAKDAEENKDECEDAVHVDEKSEIEVESESESERESDDGDFVFL